MRLNHLLALAGALNLGAPADASFIYEQDQRLLLAADIRCDPLDCETVASTELQPDPAFSTWSETLVRFGVTVSQTSTLGLSTMSLGGSAMTPSDQSCHDCSHVRGESRAGIDFSVTEVSLFSLTGEVDSATVALYRDAPVGQPILFNLPGEPIDFSGVLDTGHSYFLRMRANADSQIGSRSNESFDITFSVSPVPEPASAVLLALGLAALARARRA